MPPGHVAVNCVKTPLAGKRRNYQCQLSQEPCDFSFCSIYLMGLVLKWIEEMGGVLAMAKKSAAKSQLLYQAIEDSNGFYRWLYGNKANVPVWCRTFCVSDMIASTAAGAWSSKASAVVWTPRSGYTALLEANSSKKRFWRKRKTRKWWAWKATGSVLASRDASSLLRVIFVRWMRQNSHRNFANCSACVVKPQSAAKPALLDDR